MNTDKQYYYAVGEQVHGPVPAESLVAMYQSRHILATTLVYPVGGDQWIPLSDVLLRRLSQSPTKQDTRPLIIPEHHKKQDESNTALNVLAIFCAFPAVGVILISLFSPSALLDLWEVGISSIVIALIVAVIAKVVGR
ncbi:DUF4339 domain-containing protein [Akkermansia muciniphila]|uniref:GYF domain-containing protein n=1 Tax=Akkermansia muciniphila TaxID=239935 RepID=A0AAP8NJF1_9BACT|nr:DUF4339 domain-containing protein [Akkermansia muciniphila]PNC53404.1 hypothetical protein CXU09_11975 [Akkermansia muciniphila]